MLAPTPPNKTRKPLLPLRFRLNHLKALGHDLEKEMTALHLERTAKQELSIDGDMRCVGEINGPLVQRIDAELRAIAPFWQRDGYLGRFTNRSAHLSTIRYSF
jgi:hypothetical protein